MILVKEFFWFCVTFSCTSSGMFFLGCFKHIFQVNAIVHSMWHGVWMFDFNWLFVDWNYCRFIIIIKCSKHLKVDSTFNWHYYRSQLNMRISNFQISGYWRYSSDITFPLLSILMHLPFNLKENHHQSHMLLFFL